MTISQMSRTFGVSLPTLRFYEDRGLIKPRREGNARYYRGADRVRMEMILRGKKLGFTLSEINDLIGGKGATETPDLEERLQPHQIVNQIGHLERQRSEIDIAIERLRATHSRLSQGAAA
jgi:DNA-binding transcriptional MerR regulator